MSVRRSVIASLLVLCCAVSAIAQTAYDPATEPRVTQAKGSWHNGAAGLGDRVTVTVRNFPALLAKPPRDHPHKSGTVSADDGHYQSGLHGVTLRTGPDVGNRDPIAECGMRISDCGFGNGRCCRSQPPDSRQPE